MSIRAVVLDIGNVLIGWDPEGFYDRMMPRAEREAMFAEADLVGMNLAIDAGAPFRETVFATAERHPRWADAIRLWHDRWIELASPVIPESVDMLRRLRAQGTPVFALSNFGTSSFAYAQTQYPFLTEFDRLFISGHLGVLKPAPAIYATVEAATGLTGPEILFTDDRPENVRAAADRGWRAHLFTGPAGFANRLAQEGVLAA
jgi:2-haloacid dehalogenase